MTNYKKVNDVSAIHDGPEETYPLFKEEELANINWDMLKYK
jgi:hypothetical protein